MKNRQKEIHRIIVEQTEKRLQIERKSRKMELLVQMAGSYVSSSVMISNNSMRSQWAMALNSNLNNEEFLELSKDVQKKENESIEHLGKSMTKALKSLEGSFERIL